MSGECTVTPAHAWPDGDLINLAKLRLTAQPGVRVNANSIGSRELNSEELVEVIGDSLINTNFLRHGNFDEPSWRRGTGPQAAPAAVETSLHEDWFVKPAGGAVTVERSTTVPTNNLSLHSLKVTGGTGATTVDVGQDILRHVAQGLRAMLTISAWVYNGTGAAISSAVVRLDTANAANSFTSVTNRAEETLNTAANAQWTQVKATIAATALTNITNGLRVVFRFPSGSLDGAGKSVVLSQVKVEKGTEATPFAILPDPDDPLVPNVNLFRNGNFPAPAWIGDGAPTSSSSGSDTELCRGWLVRPEGAALTQERGDLVPGDRSLHSLKMTGAASVTTVDVSQNLLRYLATELRQELTFSAYVRNVTSLAIVPQLIVSTADAADNFTAVTARLTQNLDTCAIAAWTQVQWTFDPTAFTNITNGMRVSLRFPSGTFAGGSDVVYVAQAKLERGINRTDMLPERQEETTRLSVRWRARGLTVVNNSGTPDSKLDVTADEVMLSDASGGQVFADAVSVTVDLAAAGANGLDTGSEASGTWYYLWLISNGATVAALFSISATSPTMPSGYAYKALISAVRNDGSSNLVRMIQRDRSIWCAAQVAFTALAASASDTYQTISIATAVPPVARRCRGVVGTSTNGAYSIAVAATSAGTGAQQLAGAATGATALDGFIQCTPFEMALLSQALWWKATFNYSFAQHRMTIMGFDL